MIEIRDPGLLAAAIELELERFRHVGAVARVPPALRDLAEALGRIALMLREAERKGQAVDLGDEVMRIIQQFRFTLRTVGGAPAEA